MAYYSCFAVCLVLLMSLISAAPGNLRGASGEKEFPKQLLESSRKLAASADTSMAKGLFAQDGMGPIGASSTTFHCGEVGSGTEEKDPGHGGCLHVQPMTEPFPMDKPQTIASFLVESCGIVAPHVHANAAEVMTVVHGEGIIAQMPANGGALQVSKVSKGDSFFFGQGNYHWWMNLGTEQLLTVGVFADAAPPDAALMAYDDGAGLVREVKDKQYSLLEELIGHSDGHEDWIVYDSPLFPKLKSDYCEQARSKMQYYAYTVNSWQVAKPHLYTSQELMTGQFDIMNSAVNGPGGGLFPIAGMVLEGMPQVTGTAETGYNGGISPAMPPAAALWPGFTNVAGGKSLVKFVVGYCGMVAIHTHANAAEWNTVINGEGTVSYFPVNGGSLVTMYVKKGDTFVFPQGSAHWWVNYSPTEQLATVGGFTAPFPDTAPLADFLDESKKVNNLLTDAVLGQNYRSAIELQEMNGAGTLFPLLSTRYPSYCGGNTPCQKCN